MTEMSSRPIRQRTFARQTAEPGSPADGFLWINPAGGANGNNSERYYWNADTDVWELDSAVGPDSPLHPVSGATWRDTAAAESKQYDGAAWVLMGVTDHTGLTGVTASNHHVRYADSEAVSAVVTSFASESGDFSAVQYGGTTQVSFVSTFHEAPTSLQAGVVTRNSGTDEYYDATWESWVTDANGDITGANIYSVAQSSTGVTVRWRVNGVTL